MKEPLKDIPIEWEFPETGSPLELGSVSYIKFLSNKVYCDYEPDQFQPFFQRLLKWLNNVDSKNDQQHLLHFLTNLFFVGKSEFESLYRATYRGTIFRWIIDTYQLDPFSDQIERNVREFTNNTWICPITDSLRINSFLKVNNLKSFPMRPDWRSLIMFGCPKKILEYSEKNDIKQLILLEDFVGSGNQSKNTIIFAAKSLPDVQILLSPLIICPKGNKCFKKLDTQIPNLTYRPTLVLPENVMQDYTASVSGTASPDDLFLKRVAKKMGLIDESDAYGYEQTGAKIVLHSNCPDNTLPIFHYESANWSPLFPRVSREP